MVLFIAYFLVLAPFLSKFKLVLPHPKGVGITNDTDSLPSSI